MRDTSDPEFKGRFYISGLKCVDNSSLLHHQDNTTISASPCDSLSFSLSSSASPKGEVKNEAEREAETQAQSVGEAAKQKCVISANLFAQPENLPEIPEKYARASFIFFIGQIVQQKSSRRYVEIVEYPGIGFRFSNRTYKCRWVEPLSSDPEPTEWIQQSDLKEI